MVLKVALRLCFVKLPNLLEERIFKATLVINDIDDCSLQDMMAIIENKVSFMDLSLLQNVITVFFKEENGDRIVVDDGFFTELVKQWGKKATPVELSSSEDDGEDGMEKSVKETSATFEVEVAPSVSGTLTPSGAPVESEDKITKPAPLTIANLEKVKNTAQWKEGVPNKMAPSVGSGVRVRVGELTCPPINSSFFLRCVIISVLFKTPKPNLVVAELDLADIDAPQSEQITAVTFDEQVHKAIRENLRGDMRHVIEIRNAYVRRKTETEVRFQRNNHHLMLRLDRTCKLEVVQLLSTPISLARGTSSAIVTVRERLDTNGVLDLGSVSQRDGLIGTHASSSSTSSGAKRTVFVFSQPPTTSTTAGDLGRHGLQQQQELLKRPREEPLGTHVTWGDICRREPLLEQHANREERALDRIRRKAKTSTVCLVCKLDLENEEDCMETVRNMLSLNTRNKGTEVPSWSELRRALGDQRTEKNTNEAANRLYCKKRFVDTENRTVNLVHVRCCHLCSQYQKGETLEDAILLDANLTTCSLCGLLGATVKCYHPRCNQNFHVLCALYSNGYVNFGDKDPFLPCPACPAHTHVPTKPNPKGPVIRNSSASHFDENIAFDSRVVEAGDLRDPDEEEE